MRRESIAKSTRTYASEIRCWLRFAQLIDVDPLDPSERDVLHYVTIFRNSESAHKYITAMRWLFSYCEESQKIKVWDTSTLKQQLNGLKKVAPTSNRGEKKSIDWALAKRLVDFRESRGDYERACCYALATQLLPRVQDELLPLCMNKLSTGGHSTILMKGRCIEFHLLSRKNMPRGSIICRGCLCKESRNVLCPIHSITHYFARTHRSLQSPGRLFQCLL